VNRLTALPRALHPGAWWIWALGLAAAASRTNNPLLLGLIITAAALVVAARRTDAPWAKSFGFFVRLGIAIVIIRILIQVIFGASYGTTIVFTLPGVELPAFMAGVRLGGVVTLESLLIAFYDGLRLATIIICIGAANALASPTRLLKSIPAVLYEFGVSVVVAMTFTPQLMSDISRVRSARRLRGRPVTGPRAIAGSAMPVFEGALSRSITLAAAMDARGYGRRGEASGQRVAAGILLGGLVAACIGVYGFIAAEAPMMLGLPMLGIGLAGCVIALILAGRSSVRTTYRPDPWRAAEWLVAGAGVAVALAFLAATWLGETGLTTATLPPQWPELPALAMVGILLAVTPLLTAPPVPVVEPRMMVTT
jgi:energy-coupling factor transport system permease protein